MLICLHSVTKNVSFIHEVVWEVVNKDFVVEDQVDAILQNLLNLMILHLFSTVTQIVFEVLYADFEPLVFCILVVVLGGKHF